MAGARRGSRSGALGRIGGSLDVLRRTRPGGIRDGQGVRGGEELVTQVEAKLVGEERWGEWSEPQGEAGATGRANSRAAAGCKVTRRPDGAAASGNRAPGADTVGKRHTRWFGVTGPGVGLRWRCGRRRRSTARSWARRRRGRLLWCCRRSAKRCRWPFGAAGRRQYRHCRPARWCK